MTCLPYCWWCICCPQLQNAKGRHQRSAPFRQLTMYWDLLRCLNVFLIYLEIHSFKIKYQKHSEVLHYCRHETISCKAQMAAAAFDELFKAHFEHTLCTSHHESLTNFYMFNVEPSKKDQESENWGQDFSVERSDLRQSQSMFTCFICKTSHGNSSLIFGVWNFYTDFTLGSSWVNDV